MCVIQIAALETHPNEKQEESLLRARIMGHKTGIANHKKNYSIGRREMIGQTSIIDR